VQFIFSYTTTFFTLVGLSDTFIITVGISLRGLVTCAFGIMPDSLQIIVDCIEVLGVVASFFVVNRFGRRPLLLYT
jgi:SP family sugar:H+ symporter-like MFS transporter